MFKNSEDISKYLKTNPCVLAPMVDHSDFPFRMLTRKYGAGLCFTPMLHSRLLVQDEKYFKRMFVVGKEEDRPLVVQLCGHDKHILLQAVNKIKDQCDIIGIEFGFF
jgi:tRNA-dihydrouridine synthase 1